MTDSTQQVWVIPGDPNDLAPLPALQLGERLFADYNRREKTFGDFYEHLFLKAYSTFDECRAAMIEARTVAYDEARAHAGVLARSIEHIRTIPTATFPNVIREVSEAQQQEPEEEKTEGQKEVKPALRRPSRKS
jgi:hypothetical protein